MRVSIYFYYYYFVLGHWEEEGRGLDFAPTQIQTRRDSSTTLNRNRCLIQVSWDAVNIILIESNKRVITFPVSSKGGAGFIWNERGYYYSFPSSSKFICWQLPQWVKIVTINLQFCKVNLNQYDLLFLLQFTYFVYR